MASGARRADKQWGGSGHVSVSASVPLAGCGGTSGHGVGQQGLGVWGTCEQVQPHG